MADDSYRVVIVIIPCQTSTVQDFTVQKFGSTSRCDTLPSPTLGTQDFMTKEERTVEYGLCTLFSDFTVVGIRSALRTVIAALSTNDH
jgi:hypothetical protein